MQTIMLITTTVLSGLMAGLFYAWSISVTPGLAMIGDDHYLQAFQSMNRAILNPAFFIAFMGLAVLLPLLSYLSYTAELSTKFWYILIATMLYLGGIILITFFGNVPLNNMLEALSIESMSGEQMDAFRSAFEKKWNRLNWIRTVSSLLSFLLLVLACLNK
ncbi:MAG: DUF1772 domain-containing protein [Bacteroidota bacterium]